MVKEFLKREKSLILVQNWILFKKVDLGIPITKSVLVKEERMQNNSLKENPDIRLEIQQQIREIMVLEGEKVATEKKSKDKLRQDELDLID